MKVFIGILIAIIILGGIYIFYFKQKNQIKNNQPTPQFQNDIPIESEVESASLTSIEGQEGKGVATRQKIDSIFVHGITAELPPSSDDKVYIAWLTKNGDMTTAIKTGKLKLQDDNYSLDYSSPVDYMSYPEVIITLQSEIQTTLGRVILKGAFQF